MEIGRLTAAEAVRRREIAVVLLMVFTAGIFTVARWASARWEGKRSSLGREWAASAERNLQDQQPRMAVDAYRNALAYDHDDPELQFGLALALQKTGEADEAEAYIQSLLQREPGNGRFNLALARIEAQRHDVSRAVQAYRAALWSRWGKDEIADRSQAWIELIRLYLQTGSTQEAAAQALALSADLPKQDPRQVELAKTLFAQHRNLEAEDVVSALLRADPKNRDAMELEGEILLQQRQYAKALTRLRDADAHGPARDTAEKAVELDPRALGLDGREKAGRLQAIVNRVEQRLLQCRPNGLLLQQGDELIKRATAKEVAMNPALVDEVLAFGLEREMDVQGCGGDEAADRAIRLLGSAQ